MTTTSHLLDSGWLSLVIAGHDSGKVSATTVTTDPARTGLHKAPNTISAKLKVTCEKMDLEKARNGSLSSQEESCIGGCSRKNRPKNPK